MITQIIHRTSIIICIQFPIEINILTLVDFKNIFDQNSTMRLDKCQLFYQKFSHAYQLYKLETPESSTINFNVAIFSRDNQKVPYQIPNELIRVVEKKGANAQIIWDDLALDNAEKAYPIMHKLENKYRSTLNLIMINHFGSKWHKKYFPSKLYNKIKRTHNYREDQPHKSSQELLSALDFIDIADFIFNRNQLISENKDIITYIENNIDLDSNYLRTLLPKSNWERIIKNYLIIKEGDFKEYWNELYRIRCKIAHNRGITTDELEYVKIKSNFLSSNLNALLKSRHMSEPQEYKVGGLTIQRCGNYDIECVICFGNIVENNPEIYKKVQNKLIRNGYNIGKNVADGIIDANTKKALVSFQKDNGLPIGSLDLQTLKALSVM